MAITLEPEELMERNLFEAVLRRVADKIADAYIAEHYQEIVAAIRPEAIATLAVAESGAKIRESLEKNIPGQVREIVKKEVYQRGVFGGTRRIL